MRALIIAAGLALLAGCGAQPGMLARDTATPATCLPLFERLDWIERFYPSYGRSFVVEDFRQTPILARQVRLIRQSGCMTSVQDLAPMDGLAAELAPFARVEGDGPPVSSALQVGIVDSLAAEIRAATFFANLGYRYRSTGVEGLGRRVYIGPIRSAAEMEQAVEVARRAGFIAPYPARWVRF